VPLNLARVRADFHPLVPKGTAMGNRELTLTELLDDPMTRAVMAADRVDPAALKAVLSAVARRLQLNLSAEPIRDYIGRNDRPW
jgi:hypothetical protein